MGGEKLETNALTGITKQATMSRLPASTKSSKVHPARRPQRRAERPTSAFAGKGVQARPCTHGGGHMPTLGGRAAGQWDVSQRESDAESSKVELVCESASPNSDALFMGLVNMSAMLSAVRTKGTSSSKDSTMSRMKKWRRWTCFMRSWCCGL